MRYHYEKPDIYLSMCGLKVDEEDYEYESDEEVEWTEEMLDVWKSIFLRSSSLSLLHSVPNRGKGTGSYSTTI